MTEETIGLDDEDLLSNNRPDRYKGEDGVVDRISFCWFATDADGDPLMSKEDTPRFRKDSVHWLDGMGYAKDNSYLRSKKGSPKDRIGTVIVVYRTDSEGNFPTNEEGKRQFGYDIKTWEFGRDKYKQLVKLNSEWPLSYHDIKADCEDESWQRFNFTPCKGEAIWRKKEKVRNEVLEAAREYADQISIGREIPKEELREYFGEDDIESPEVSENVDEYDELLDDI